MNQGQSSRPQKIRQAVILLYVTLGIGVLWNLVEILQDSEVVSVQLLTIFIAIAVAMWFFIHMIGKGGNWARITLLVLVIIGISRSIFEAGESVPPDLRAAPSLFQYFGPLLERLAANPVSGLLGIGQMVILTIALILLFQKPSSDWYREMNAPRQAD